MNGGNDCDFTNDEEILEINSPQHAVGGPFRVVYKDIDSRWAIVALDWNEEPRLGIRWFWENSGTPVSSGHPIWFILPPALYTAILDGLPLDIGFRKQIEQYLCGEINGDDVREEEE